MRVLITGANGMLGRDLQEALRGSAEVHPLAHAECDITNPPSLTRVFAQVHPQFVINCAAYTDVDGCERHAELAMKVNAQGPGNVARAAEEIGARVFHISTDYVFDGADRWDGRGATPDFSAWKPYVETDATQAISMYGRSKLEGEKALLAGENPGRHLAIRTSWLYGRSRVNFVDRVVEQALKGGPVKAVTDQISCLTWTRELARAIAALVSRQPERPAGGILHLAGSGMSTRFDNARHIVEWLESNRRLNQPVALAGTTWTSLNLPAKRPSFSAMSSSRLAEMGIEALPDWRTSLNEYLSLRLNS